MPSDNVTPFRRPKPVRPQQTGGWGFKTHRGKAMLVQFLTLIAFVLNFAGAAAGQILFTLGGFDVSQARIALWIAGIGVSVAAVLIALANRDQGMPWANTHHEHALRTLFIGYAIWTIGSVLGYIHGMLAVITIFVQFGVAIWAILRAVIGLGLAVGRKAIPHPRGAFI